MFLSLSAELIVWCSTPLWSPICYCCTCQLLQCTMVPLELQLGQLSIPGVIVVMYIAEYIGPSRRDKSYEEAKHENNYVESNRSCD